jgi:hypothetical protein
VRLLGWSPKCLVSVRVLNGPVMVVTRSSGPDSVTRQGYLRLPASVRHACHIDPGSRLLVVACRDNDLLAIYPTSVLDAILLAYQVSLSDVAA